MPEETQAKIRAALPNDGFPNVISAKELNKAHKTLFGHDLTDVEPCEFFDCAYADGYYAFSYSDGCLGASVMPQITSVKALSAIEYSVEFILCNHCKERLNKSGSKTYLSLEKNNEKTLIGTKNKDLLLDEREIYTVRIVVSENGAMHIDALHKNGKN